jgi:hypothetical protein
MASDHLTRQIIPPRDICVLRVHLRPYLRET